MNLLEIVTTVLAQIGFPQPSGVVGSKDLTVSQMSAIFSQLGAELITQHTWQRLQTEHLLTTRAFDTQAQTTQGSSIVFLSDTTSLNTDWMITGVGFAPFSRVLDVLSSTKVKMSVACTQSGTGAATCHKYAYPLPDDWQRQMPITEWNRSGHRPVKGPQTATAWQQYKSGTIYAGTDDLFRLVGNAFTLMPVPADGITFAYEYISKNWVVNGDSQKATVTADTDEFIFSDALLMTGMKARWFDAHGMDSTIEKADFAALLEREKSQDIGGAMLSIASAAQSVLLGRRNIPEGNW